MKGVTVLVLCLSIAVGSVLCQENPNDGRPGCLTRYEFKRFWRNRIDNSMFFNCTNWGESKEMVCPQGTLFQESWQTCVPVKNYIELPFYDPPTSAYSSDELACKEIIFPPQCQPNENESSPPTDTTPIYTTEPPTGTPNTEEPTESPTEAPTEEQTDGTTPSPTENPTTDAPTEEPTDGTTPGQTENPTQAPTEEPTDGTTPSPTENPTEAPTEQPTTPSEGPTTTTTEAPTTTTTEAPIIQLCSGASPDSGAPGDMSCRQPICTEEEWRANRHLPSRDPTTFYQCASPGIAVRKDCPGGTCFSYQYQVCVHPYQWKNSCM